MKSLVALMIILASSFVYAEEFVGSFYSEQVHFNLKSTGASFAAVATIYDLHGHKVQDLALTDWDCENCWHSYYLYDVRGKRTFYASYTGNAIVSYCNLKSAEAMQQHKKVAINLGYFNSPWACSVGSEER